MTNADKLIVVFLLITVRAGTAEPKLGRTNRRGRARSVRRVRDLLCDMQILERRVEEGCGRCHDDLNQTISDKGD